MIKRHEIIVVEDEFISALEITTILRSKGYDVINGIARGENAIKIIKETKPALIILDIMLKDDITGIAVAEWAQFFNIPYIFVTASSDDDTLSKINKMHPVSTIIKPFSQNELLFAVSQAFN